MIRPMWIDSHCHLDAPEFNADRDAVVARAQAAGVTMAVLPAVEVANFDAVRSLAHRHGWVYALGIHPLYADRAGSDDLARLDAALTAHANDPRLVAVGEIGVDHFVPGLDRARQEKLYAEQLRLAVRHRLPVILHVRRSADVLLKHLRRCPHQGGIAHAFNGSEQQAQAMVEQGLALGFGGALTFDRALQIRRLAQCLPASSIVLETDAPDIPPQWLYRTMAQREQAAHEGTDASQARNEPSQVPRLADTLASLRRWTPLEVATRTTANVRRVLPRLDALMAGLPATAAPKALASAAAPPGRTVSQFA